MNKIKKAASLALAFLIGGAAIATLPLGIHFAIAKESSQGIIAAGSLTTVLLAGLYTAWKFNLFRESKPHLTITQSLYKRRNSTGHYLVTIKTNLHNSSRVMVRIPKTWCRLQQTAPITKAEVERIYQEATKEDPSTPYPEYPWYFLAQEEMEWANGGLEIEPGQTRELTFQFIINEKVNALAITTAFLRDNEPKKKAKPAHRHGWKCYNNFDLTP